jgi:hypothetical protein
LRSWYSWLFSFRPALALINCIKRARIQLVDFMNIPLLIFLQE